MENLKVRVESSARHIHITGDALKTLFGQDAQLHPKRELSQPGQFLCEEKVTVEGPRGCLNMSILGPERPANQVEISLTDARTLGVTPPIRESGDIRGSTPVRLVGPAGTVELPEGVIIAKRHLHITPELAAQYGLKDSEIVMLKVGGDRALIFDEVVCRISPKFAPAVHLDTDEFNAAGLCGEVIGEIIKK